MVTYSKDQNICIFHLGESSAYLSIQSIFLPLNFCSTGARILFDSVHMSIQNVFLLSPVLVSV